MHENSERPVRSHLHFPFSPSLKRSKTQNSESLSAEHDERTMPMTALHSLSPCGKSNSKLDVSAVQQLMCDADDEYAPLVEWVKVLPAG